MTYEEYCDKLEDNNMSEQALSGRNAINALREEFHLGVLVNTDYICVVGRKPF